MPVPLLVLLLAWAVQCNQLPQLNNEGLVNRRGLFCWDRMSLVIH